MACGGCERESPTRLRCPRPRGGHPGIGHENRGLSPIIRVPYYSRSSFCVAWSNWLAFMSASIVAAIFELKHGRNKIFFRIALMYC